MKYIEKGRTPGDLARWYRRQNGQNCSYDDMPGDVRTAVKSRLLSEQGGLCGYTGIRITEGSCHIEHLKPQTLCEKGTEDVNYRNLLAAYPRPPQKDESSCPFGAHRKGQWYDAEGFVHPLRRDCAVRFRFDLDGQISPRAGDENAQMTIASLGLDHNTLVELRKQAIDDELFPEGREISDAAAQRLRNEVLARGRNGRFREFCFVIAQACEEYLRRRARTRTRRNAIRCQQR